MMTNKLLLLSIRKVKKMSKTIKDFKLNTLLESHNRWLSNESPGRRANLENHNLSNLDFTNKNLIGSMLNNSVFKNSKFIDCDFNNASMQETEIEDSDFNGSDLSRVNLRGTEVRNSCFTRVRAVKSNYSYTEFHNTDMDFMECVDTDFSYSIIKQCDIFKTTFIKCNFTGSKMELMKHVRDAVFEDCINLPTINEEIQVTGETITLNGE